MSERRVEYMPLDAIARAPRNPKGHARNEIGASISRYGLAELPLLDERTGRLVAGHGRLDDLTERHKAGEDPPDGVRTVKGGGWLVPVVRGWSSRSDPEAEAYLVASNHLTTLGGWDDEELAAILSDLAELDPDLLAVTGFTDDDLAALLGEPEGEDAPGEPEGDPDHVPGPPAKPVTQPGDVWLLGPHRIIAGDCRDYETVSKLLGDVRVNVAFTSPPYASQRSYDPSSGFKPIPPGEYVDWFEDVQANIRAVLADDGSWFVNIKEHCEDGQRHLYVKDLTIAHVRRWGWLFVDELIWHKPDPFPGYYEGRFKNGFEPVLHFSSGGHRHRPEHVLSDSDSAIIGAATHKRSPGVLANEELAAPKGAGKVWPSNVVTLGAGSESDGGRHAAAFPVRLPGWFIRAYSDPGDVVFDPFMGSGTTLIAAHQEGRVAYGCEISPAYCDVICRRWQQQHPDDTPILEATGEPHDFLEPANA